jgi:hypothetical protein
VLSEIRIGRFRGKRATAGSSLGHKQFAKASAGGNSESLVGGKHSVTRAGCGSRHPDNGAGNSGRDQRGEVRYFSPVSRFCRANSFNVVPAIRCGFPSVESVARDGPKRVLGLLFRGFVAREVTEAPAPYTGAASPGLSRGEKWRQGRRVQPGSLLSHSKNSLALDRQPDARRSASPRSPCCRGNTAVPGNRTSDAVRGVPAPE